MTPSGTFTASIRLFYGTNQEAACLGVHPTAEATGTAFAVANRQKHKQALRFVLRVRV